MSACCRTVSLKSLRVVMEQNTVCRMVRWMILLRTNLLLYCARKTSSHAMRKMFLGCDKDYVAFQPVQKSDFLLKSPSGEVLSTVLCLKTQTSPQITLITLIYTDQKVQI